jgi:(p)ppGpp synthase/HD superfamily hydrolase
MLFTRRIADLVTGLPKSREALAYAGRLHAGQSRQFDDSPFIHHPIEVAAVLYYAGAPDHLIAAGLLHDTLEKTDLRAPELCKRFGARIAAIVLAVTEDKQIADYDRRKAAAREQAAAAGHEPLMVLAADKISKVRELQSEAAAARRRKVALRSPSRERRLVHYRECLRLLEQHCDDSPLVSQLRAELDQLPDVLTRRRPHAGAAV